MLPKLRVLLIVTSGKTGGAQQSVFNLAAYLERKGVDITVGLGKGDFLINKLKSAGIQYTQFYWLKRTINPVTNLLFINELKKYLNKNKYQVVHFNSSNALVGAIAAKLAVNKPKVVFTLRGLSLLDPNYDQFLNKHASKLFFKILLRQVDAPVFVSHENKQAASLINIGKEGVVIENGLPDLIFHSRADARNKIREKTAASVNESIWIGSIGRLVYQKNYEFLIEQMAKLVKIKNNIALFIIGDGPQKLRLQKIIKQLDLEKNVFLLGDIPDAFQLMKAFDIFTLPSRFEGMSITLIEALKAGIPILASAVGGARRMLSDAGLTYELNDAKEFQQKMLYLINNEDIRKKLADDAQLRGQHFTIERTANQYWELYRKLCAE